MRIKKKAQQALEFMLILVFVMLIISSVIYLSGKLTVDFKEKEKKNQVDNFVDVINSEIDIMSKTQSGYYRELELPYNKYEVNISSSELYVVDLNDNNKTYFYEIKGNYSIYLKEIEKYGENVTVIVFEKTSFLENNN